MIHKSEGCYSITVAVLSCKPLIASWDGSILMIFHRLPYCFIFLFSDPFIPQTFKHLSDPVLSPEEVDCPVGETEKQFIIDELCAE